VTLEEAAIISAYTGILIGSFDRFHEYAQKLFNRPIFTHEFADKSIVKKLKELSKADFIKLHETIEEQAK